MLFRRTAVILLILVALGIVGGMLWLQAESRLVSYPSNPRASVEYELAVGSGTNIPPVPENYFAQFRVEESSNTVRLNSPSLSPGPHGIDYGSIEMRRAPDSQATAIEDGAVSLAFIGVAYGAPKTNFDWAVELPAKFYKPSDGAPVEPDESGPPAYDRKLEFSGLFPAAGFYFTRSNLAEFKPLKLRVFDARTKQNLDSGSYGMGQLHSNFWFTTSPQIWHQAPLELVLTFAIGPTKTVSMPARTGAEVDYGGGALKLLYVAEGGINGFSSTSTGATNVRTFRVGQPLPYETRPQTSFVFLSWPGGGHARTELEFYDPDGKKLEGGGGYSSDSVIVTTAIASAGQVSEIRVRFYPRTLRSIFTIPELPGLPEENRNVENLFDVRIPYARLQYESDLIRLVENSLQMKMDRMALTYPNGYFPAVRTNFTPRELFLEIRGLLSRPDYQLAPDPEANHIELRQSPIRALIEQFKKRTGM